MKIRKHYLYDFIYLLLILTLISCKKVNENLINSVNEKSVNLVPFELAKRVAESFDSAIFFKRNVTQSIARASIVSLESPTKNKKIIKSQIVIKDHDSIPALYLFNYEDNGFLVISADFKHEPIMAYVKNGHIEIGDKIPSGFAIWVMKSIFNIESLRKNLYDNSGRAKRAWEIFLSDNNIELDVSNIKIDNSRNIVGTNGIAPPDPIIPCDQVDAVTIGPLIQYYWGQRCTYNNLCDLGHSYGCNISCGNDRPPTGCVATAMSQVIAFWQYPNNYNYQSMPLNSGNLAVQQLMADAGISVGMNYGCTESSVTDIPILGIRSKEKIRDAFLNSFGYTNATYSL